MAKNNHYTSDHWKVGGNGFSGENILHEVNKQQYNQAQKAKEENASLIPNHNEHNESPAAKGVTNRAMLRSLQIHRAAITNFFS